MKIYAPVKDANGVWCSVRFVNGVGETNNTHLIDWFKSHGYNVEQPKVILEEKPTLDEVVDSIVDFDNMTPNELREWMKANGYGSRIKNIRDKEKLLNIIRG